MNLIHTFTTKIQKYQQVVKDLVKYFKGKSGILPRDEEIKAWYKLLDTEKQLAFAKSDKRFILVSAGRRSGKTITMMRKIVLEALKHPGRYMIGSNTHQQVKRIFWNQMKLLTMSSTHKRKPSETELIIYLPNSSTVELVSLTESKRIEGVSWKMIATDESADMKDSSVFQQSIFPALATLDTQTNTKPKGYFISVPNGFNHFHEMYLNAKQDQENWDVFEWPSSDLLDSETLNTFKRQMSLKAYKVEFEASFLTTEGRIYSDFDENNNSKAEINFDR